MANRPRILSHRTALGKTLANQLRKAANSPAPSAFSARALPVGLPSRLLRRSRNTADRAATETTEPGGDRLKPVPYLSRKRNSAANFNGFIIAPGKRIFCDMLSLAWLTDRQRFLDAAQSKIALRNYFRERGRLKRLADIAQ